MAKPFGAVLLTYEYGCSSRRVAPRILSRNRAHSAADAQIDDREGNVANIMLQATSVWIAYR